MEMVTTLAVPYHALVGVPWSDGGADLALCGTPSPVTRLKVLEIVACRRIWEGARMVLDILFKQIVDLVTQVDQYQCGSLTCTVSGSLW